ncbi:MAG: type VI secretion system contractile sheath large subunit [Fuerstiella sp.]
MQNESVQPSAANSVTVAVEHHAGGASASLLDRVVDGGSAPADRRESTTDPLHGFLGESSQARRLILWLGKVPSNPAEWEAAQLTLARDIARIDQLLEEQVNQILHAPEFQALEASWRGLHFLWSTRESLVSERGFDEKSTRVELRILDVSKRELQRDFEKAAEFDQNALFKKVYEEEFGMAGGTPYGLLLANYEFTNHPEDLDLLLQLSGVAAAAFAPVIAAASPDLIGLDRFSDLEKPVDLEGIFQQARHRKWRSLRERPDTQFLGLTLPRVLMREPYRDGEQKSHGFRFQEDVCGPDNSRYLWGSSAWALGAVILRAFADCGWFADIRGVQRGVEGGGLVTGLPTHEFHTDAAGVAMRSSTEVAVSDDQESELCELGFIPLSHCKDTPYSVFYSNQSVHRPDRYDDPLATANAKISAMLQYVLCCSRIAHYLKVKARAKVGSFRSPMEIQNELNAWLVDYVTPDDKAPPEMKAMYPLREAEVQVADLPGQPGRYMLTIRLLPHYQLDQLSSSMTLVARRVDLKD